MKTFFAVLALTLAGTGHAAPTTFYFSGTADLHRVIESSTNTWINGAAQAFSGSITVDGRNGALTSVLGFPAEVQSMQRITSSQCGLTTGGQCSGEPPAPTNFLGFTLNFGGMTYGSWATGIAGSVEYSSVTKLRSASDSSYTVVGGMSGDQAISSLPMGGLRRLFSTVGVGVTLAGDSQAVGDVYDPGQFPDLARFTPGVSELRFDSSAYSCNQVDGACQDTVFDPDSVVLIGKLNYVGLAPEAAAEVPEPTSAALVLAGALGLLGTRLRMHTRARRS
jgi:hypothetical protein